MAITVLVLLSALATIRADSQDTQGPSSQARQFMYGSQYPLDLQYDFSLLDPQLQYPQFSGGSPRVQPQVFVYQGAAPGQPFLLQPGAPPGNFLIPQPQPGFVLRDVPQARPDVFISGYPKPAYVPPINKDAEEIPTNPGAYQPNPMQDRKPEKLETLDEEPEQLEPTGGEADALASADRTFGKLPPLKPGHRFFILNGQPLFSNYPLPQFPNSPYQPSLDAFGPEGKEFYSFRQSGPSFLPEGFSKHQLSDSSPNKVPIGSFFVRNSITGQINGAKEHEYENPQNEIGQHQNFVALNQRDQPTSDVLIKNLQILPYKKQNYEQLPPYVNVKGSTYPSFKLKPIEVQNIQDDSSIRSRSEDTGDDNESAVISAKPEPTKQPTLEVGPAAEKLAEPGISRSQPNALALAGPGGVAAAAPRATALTGDRGISVSSPQATAIAGPTKDQVREKPINKRP